MQLRIAGGQPPVAEADRGPYRPRGRSARGRGSALGRAGQPGAGPVGGVVCVAVAAVVDDEIQRLGAGHVDVARQGGGRAGEYGGGGQHLSVGEHAEGHRSVRGAASSSTPTVAVNRLHLQPRWNITSPQVWTPRPLAYRVLRIMIRWLSPAACSPLDGSRSPGPQPLVLDANVSCFERDPGRSPGRVETADRGVPRLRHRQTARTRWIPS